MTTAQQPSDITTAARAAGLNSLPPVPPPQFQVVPGGGYHAAQVDSWVKKVGERLLALEHAIETGAARAVQVIAKVEANPKSRMLTEDLMRIALDEIAGMRTQASADIAQMMADARTQAAATLDQAHAEAAQVTGGAHEQAQAVLNDARKTAKQQLDDAAAKASAVSEGAQARLDALVGIHKESFARMKEIADVASQYVQSEGARGSLEEEVQRLVTPQQPQEQAAAATQGRPARRPAGQQAAES